MTWVETEEIKGLKFLEVLAQKIFNHDTNWESLSEVYKQSTELPDDRYGKKIEKKLLYFKNKHVRDWDRLGLNERYIAAKIYSDSNSIFLLGRLDQENHFP